MMQNAKYVIGVDLGGTKIEGVLFEFCEAKKGNWKYKTIKSMRMPTNSDKSRIETLVNLHLVLKSLMAGIPQGKISGIGIGTPGFVTNGKLTLIKNVPSLMGYDLRYDIIKAAGIKNVVIENDANCFALAEHRFGAGVGKQTIVGLILGTGVGGGLIIDGKLYRGACGGAGEIGHTTLNNHGLACSCGGYGHFESYCCGPAIVRLYRIYGGKLKNPDPRAVFGSFEKAAKKARDEFFDKIGMGLGNLINILNPEMIVLGGGVSNLNFYPQIRRAAKRYSNAEIFKCVKIVRNKLGDSSGVLGAASLVLED
jgi:fructokinase